ncbi:MAG: lysophospholipid acyltransferase family protein [Candidatus Sumerlaeaceae bacterium]|jgi:KDO2-lipid IV(A) lauroyltransferase
MQNEHENEYKRERRPSLRHWLEYAGWKLAACVLPRLPRRVVVKIADVLGWVMYRVLRVRRRVVEENLERAFGTGKTRAELDAIALRTYQNAVLSFCEFINPSYSGQGALAVFREIRGMEHAEPFRSRPAVFLTGHIGNWELQGAAVAALGFQMDAVLKPLHNPLIDREVARRRLQRGFGLIPTTGPLKAIVSSIRTGRHPVFLADQDARRSGMFVDFFGHPASTATGPAYFALKLKVPIIVGFSTRNRDRQRTLTLHIFPPIEPDADAPFQEELLRLTQEHVNMLEGLVRDYPDSYFWLHRRWKTRPRRGEWLAATKGSE